ncbi:mechanosensitive ion channel family protein [Bacteroides sp. OttesenSCG-928-E20]|nr:mechanosensitive ion channel family protein [Bacteroides sp. OttesenSCG-928-N06]MDL2299351.1 mechanosensitive ion channel family protein [Bacteroides sp. OttesenSCG-928-E20]MDL2304689.1 mechanosensitive ion channel family protein [Bacteroides sp. OttesenSCG-928-D19]
MNGIKEVLNSFLTSLGLSNSTADVIDKLIILLVIIALAFLVEKLCKRLVIPGIHKLVKSTKATWDDIIFADKVIGGLAGMISPLLVYMFVSLAYEQGTEGFILVQKLCTVYMIAVFIRFLSALLTAFYTIYSRKEQFRDRPLKGLLQTVQVILYFIAGIAIVSILIDKSPAVLLTGLGASAAILMLVFQDSILGFVSGIQLSANDMLRVGDWIEMPKYGVDGDVIEVTLNTVKIQNWDKTIVTIPPTLLMKDSFKNWRGMSESGGRRVKRSIYVDMTSVQFCTQEMLENYNKIQVLSAYIDEKEKALTEYNSTHNIDASVMVNGRRQTNLGVFRAYLSNYLKNHPSVNHDMTCMVRQLQPTDKGIPLELYFFTATTVWAAYEDIQSDIFDHVLAVIPYFDLNVYQAPSGKDLIGVKNSLQ